MKDLALAIPKKKDVETMDLIVGGKRIGMVILGSTPCRYHLVVEGGPSEGLAALHQGHGDTLDEAITDMLDRGEQYASAQLIRLRELRGLLQS